MSRAVLNYVQWKVMSDSLFDSFAAAARTGLLAHRGIENRSDADFKELASDVFRVAAAMCQYRETVGAAARKEFSPVLSEATRR